MAEPTSLWNESTLGTDAYQAKDYAGAVIHTQNAVLMSRFDRNQRNNLKMAQEAIESGYGRTTGHPADLGFQLSTWIRPKESASLAFLFLNLFLLFRFLHKPKFKRDLSIGFLIFAGLSISAIGFYGESVGVITAPTKLLRQPVESSLVIRDLPAGTRVRKVQNSGEFVKVERTDGFVGWIKKETLHTFF